MNDDILRRGKYPMYIFVMASYDGIHKSPMGMGKFNRQGSKYEPEKWQWIFLRNSMLIHVNMYN